MRLRMRISMSLDGFVAGPNQSVDTPLGEGGEGLHEWAFALEAWREQGHHHGPQHVRRTSRSMDSPLR